MGGGEVCVCVCKREREEGRGASVCEPGNETVHLT